MALPEPLVNADAAAALRAALLHWYAAHRRDLPWRESTDPYAVWISEVMLQQTQVQTVIPYFRRWLERFPTVSALAEAPLEEVLRHWAGLGYYARARNLHRAAQAVVQRHGGRVPGDPDALQALPGVGRYTAGAILSIAFGIPAPILDANAIRVLTRLFAMEGDPARGETQRRLWALAEALVSPEHPGDFNQAMMEVGATVCSPEAPACAACPVAGACLARAQGRQEDFPQTRKGPAIVVQEHVSVVLRREGSVLLVRRPEDALWGGLWEFPRAVRREEESLPECARRAAHETLGIAVETAERLAVVRHTVTHHRITLHALAGRLVRGEPQAVGCADWAWTPLDAVGDRPLPAPQARILKALLHRRRPPAGQRTLDLDESAPGDADG